MPIFRHNSQNTPSRLDRSTKRGLILLAESSKRPRGSKVTRGALDPISSERLNVLENRRPRSRWNRAFSFLIGRVAATRFPHLPWINRRPPRDISNPWVAGVYSYMCVFVRVNRFVSLHQCPFRKGNNRGFK